MNPHSKSKRRAAPRSGWLIGGGIARLINQVNFTAMFVVFESIAN